MDKIINNQEQDFENKQYNVFNEELGKEVVVDPQTQAFNNVMKDALDYCKIKSDFQPVLDYFNNIILRIYSAPEFNQIELE